MKYFVEVDIFCRNRLAPDKKIFPIKIEILNHRKNGKCFCMCRIISGSASLSRTEGRSDRVRWGRWWTLRRYFQLKQEDIIYTYTVKKRWRPSRPQPGCHLPNSLWAEIIKLIQPRESLISDIPAGDGNVANVFLQCTVLYIQLYMY